MGGLIVWRHNRAHAGHVPVLHLYVLLVAAAGGHVPQAGRTCAACHAGLVSPCPVLQRIHARRWGRG